MQRLLLQGAVIDREPSQALYTAIYSCPPRAGPVHAAVRAGSLAALDVLDELGAPFDRQGVRHRARPAPQARSSRVIGAAQAGSTPPLSIAVALRNAVVAERVCRALQRHGQPPALRDVEEAVRADHARLLDVLHRFGAPLDSRPVCC
jgi:hypothetical protein